VTKNFPEFSFLIICTGLLCFPLAVQIEPLYHNHLTRQGYIMNLNDINLLFESTIGQKKNAGRGWLAFGRIALQRLKTASGLSTHACPHLRRKMSGCTGSPARPVQISHGSRLAGLRCRQSKMAGGRERDACIRSSLTEEQLQKTFTFLNVKVTGSQRVVQALQHLSTTAHIIATNHLDDSTARRNAGEYWPYWILPAKK